MVIKSHPILIVLLSSVSTSATRLILRLLTPCKKKQSPSQTQAGQRYTGVHRRVYARTHAHMHTSADSDGYNHCQE